MLPSYYLGKPVTKGHLSCRDSLAWIQRCPSSQVLLYFHPILTCVFHASIMQFFHTVHFHTFSHWLTTWRGNSTSTYKSLFTGGPYVTTEKFRESSGGFSSISTWSSVYTLLVCVTTPTHNPDVEGSCPCCAGLASPRVPNPDRREESHVGANQPSEACHRSLFSGGSKGGGRVRGVRTLPEIPWKKFLLMEK